MRVRFTGVEGCPADLRQGAEVLRSGRDYIVLEVYCQVDGPNYFRIEFQIGEFPPLFDSRIFEVVDCSIHSSWVVSVEWEGSLTMGPQSWQESDFWEDLMEHSPKAVGAYNLERNSLMPGSDSER